MEKTESNKPQGHGSQPTGMAGDFALVGQARVIGEGLQLHMAGDQGKASGLGVVLLEFLSIFQGKNTPDMMVGLHWELL